MKISLKKLTIIFLSLSCLSVDFTLTDGNSVEIRQFWIWADTFPKFHFIWDVIWWGPALIATIISICYFRRVLKTHVLNEIVAISLSIALGFFLDWIHLCAFYRTLSPGNWTFWTLSPISFYYQFALPLTILGSVAIATTIFCLTPELLGRRHVPLT